MKTIFICALALAVILGSMYAVYPIKDTSIFRAIRLLAMLAFFATALVCANFSSAIGGYSLCILLCFAFLLAYEGIGDDDCKGASQVIKKSCYAIACLLIMAAGIRLADFNIYVLISGALLGIGLAIIRVATNEDKHLSCILTPFLTFISVSLLLTQAIFVIKQSFDLVNIIFSAGALFTFAATILIEYRKNKRVYNITSKFIYIIGLIAIAASIYFI